ncbi:MAG: alpha/beta fold hydrolase [Planctomycetota bacterium]
MTYAARFVSIALSNQVPEADSGATDVFWFHHAGGGLNALTAQARRARPQHAVRLWSAKMPCREDMSDITFDGSLIELARLLADRIIAVHPADRPLVIVGHSFGSVMAYQVTRRLVECGLIPTRLVVSSFPPPDQWERERELHQVSDEELVRAVNEQFGGVPQDVMSDPEALKFFLPPMRFDFALMESYRHPPDGEPLDVPLTAICGTDDRAVDLAEMQGWSRLTKSTFRLRGMPGDHFFPLQRMGEVLDVATWGV